jgi:hypothetical protein
MEPRERLHLSHVAFSLAREKREDDFTRIAEDHVSMYQKSISRDDSDLKFHEEEDDDEGNDDLDAEEAEGLLDMIADERDADEEASSRSSEEENEASIAFLDGLARVHLVGHNGTTHSLFATLQTKGIIR